MFRQSAGSMPRVPVWTLPACRNYPNEPVACVGRMGCLRRFFFDVSGGEEGGFDFSGDHFGGDAVGGVLGFLLGQFVHQLEHDLLDHAAKRPGARVALQRLLRDGDQRVAGELQRRLISRAVMHSRTRSRFRSWSTAVSGSQRKGVCLPNGGGGYINRESNAQRWPRRGGAHDCVVFTGPKARTRSSIILIR